MQRKATLKASSARVRMSTTRIENTKQKHPVQLGQRNTSLTPSSSSCRSLSSTNRKSTWSAARTLGPNCTRPLQSR